MPISGAYQKGKGGSLRIFFKLFALLGMGTLQYEIFIEFGFVSTCVCVLKSSGIYKRMQPHLIPYFLIHIHRFWVNTTEGSNPILNYF